MRKKTLYLIALLIVSHFVKAQQNKGEKFLKFSVGRVAFGTGDLFGYSFSTELSKNLNKHINIGVEATIENGKSQPKMSDPLRAFDQVSNAALSAKFNYYPFNKIKGFNIGVGPTIGYQLKSEESQWTISYVNGAAISRTSILKYTNEIFIGYRVIIGYDFSFKQRFLVGIRTDFSVYNNGDDNTLAALKFGYKF